MSKFHITAGGAPAACKAEVRACPRGGDENHFESREAAQAAIEKRLEKELGDFPEIAKASRKRSIPVDARATERLLGKPVKNLREYIDALSSSYAKVNYAFDSDPEIMVEDWPVNFMQANYIEGIGVDTLDSKTAYLEVRAEDGFGDEATSRHGHPYIERIPVSADGVVQYGYGGDPNIRTWRYPLTAEEAKPYRAFALKQRLKPAHDALVDPALPEWAALPIRPELKPGIGKIHHSDRAVEDKRSEYFRVQQQLNGVQDYKKEIKELRKELAEIQQQEDALAGVKSEGLPAVAFAAVQESLKERTAERHRLEAELLPKQATLQRTNEKELKKDRQRLSKEMETLKDKFYEETRQERLAALAAHHPSKDAAERLAAAEDWAAEHPEYLRHSWNPKF